MGGLEGILQGGMGSDQDHGNNGLECDQGFLLRIVGGNKEHFHDSGERDQHVPDYGMEHDQEYRDDRVECDKDVLHDSLEWNQVGYHDCGKCDFHLPEHGV